MLITDISVVDGRGKRRVARVKAVRGPAHTRLPGAFYYEYQATLDSKLYTGTVVHTYINGPFSLVARITKSIVAQQKADRKAA